ncbi:tryptophan 7-halogenase [Pseudoalteromonas luteoviolacea]|uniref:tryptophan halogenase family protein n=1 Tax=Pseudoalteromonas luteoviolacea TaxID=43657 RepID=UPI001F48547F|nr:tryptophan halogenase family protein [Pseudoalteromonas luteoviolacea]MCF6442616.1 tryptophan 7-halogenase [Pseudoalteromonas luteoviolacea]
MTNRPNSIVILGGGTAGWMTAILLKHYWPEVDLTLVESEDIGIIGVGEGSTPSLKYFFELLGISDDEWMPACNATYKVGIEFPGWSNVPGHSSYFHPFFSALDSQTSSAYIKQVNRWRQGESVNVLPDNYFVASALSRAHKSVQPVNPLPVELDYGYHFDSALLGNFLRDKCISQGVRHVIDEVETVVHDNGVVHELATVGGQSFNAEFFIDCTGFAGVLVNKSLSRKFLSYNKSLLNDSAVAIQTSKASNSVLESKTVSSAMSCGWRWHIPLRNRDGNGYVYSSKYISPKEAERELRQSLGDRAEGREARHIKMRVGRLQKHWDENCLAVGLSQGFIEPLEATALMVIQYTVQSYINCVNKKGTVEQFNSKINKQFDGIKDYIVCHYKTNSISGDYWHYCRENIEVSETLETILKLWKLNGRFDDFIHSNAGELSYSRASWYSILSGMGVREKSIESAIEMDELAMKALKYCEETAELFIDHKTACNSIVTC